VALKYYFRGRNDILDAGDEAVSVPLHVGLMIGKYVHFPSTVMVGSAIESGVKKVTIAPIRAFDELAHVADKYLELATFAVLCLAHGRILRKDQITGSEVRNVGSQKTGSQSLDLWNYYIT
jgi:hypothetical protein